MGEEEDAFLPSSGKRGKSCNLQTETLETEAWTPNDVLAMVGGSSEISTIHSAKSFQDKLEQRQKIRADELWLLLTLCFAGPCESLFWGHPTIGERHLFF